MGDKPSMPASLMHRLQLSEGWSFKQADTDEWMSVRKVPTNVHLDLLDHKRIQDPFVDFNELECQWVSQKSWVYKLKLPPLNSSAADAPNYVLVFDGLDTYATVKLGGKTILESDNMFLQHRVDVSHLPLDQGLVLEIHFDPALARAQQIKDAHPEHKWVGFNGDMARLAVRKAQYHFGWDWGPVLTTCGPWKEIYLETFSTRLEDFQLEYKVDLSSSSPAVQGRLSLRVDGSADGTVRFAISLRGKDVVTVEAVADAKSVASAEFSIDDAELWYPNGYGSQVLYTATAIFTSREGIRLDSQSVTTGFRKCELIQRPDASGKAFFFRINDVDVFCGGSDWIPADSFTTRISTERYRQWVKAFVDGHQVMVRVWGGGIWEHDDFYDACDEFGVLVWQDFMFGCGNYPAYPSILQSITAEADYQTKRLRAHPSIALYAGNNEDYQVQEQYKLEYNYEDKDPQHWLETDFPARYIYEKILPEAVVTNSPHIPYHPGSPWGDGKISSDTSVGDMHQWNVWHGTQEKYQIFDTLGGRFNSEFGMEAFPHMETIQEFTTQDVSSLYAQSHVLDFHNKADGHERRIATYVVENFQILRDNSLERWVHLTQLVQAETLLYGYRGWRRQWGDKNNRHCGGALVWQMNDCWPTASWSIVDYYLRKKPAYYVLRRVLAPIAVAVKRDHHDWSVVHAKPAQQLNYECWVSSSRLDSLDAVVELRFISIATGHDIKEKIKRKIVVKPNGATTVFTGEIRNDAEEPHVLAARILVDGVIVSRDVDWPQPLKYLDMSDRGVEISCNSTREDAMEAVIKARKPTKGFVFEERTGVLLGDSAVDLVPGDDQSISIQGLTSAAAALRWTYYGAP